VTLVYCSECTQVSAVVLKSGWFHLVFIAPLYFLDVSAFMLHISTEGLPLRTNKQVDVFSRINGQYFPFK